MFKTSYYTKKQFKAFKSLEAFNQMVYGFARSVQRLIISGKFVVMEKVRHSKHMNDLLVETWLVVDKEGKILSSHCLMAMENWHAAK